ncbi:hypothetical protein AGMMS49965_14420 [Bacteroidia bacterium]|nr:hypothetical protein AGMMS49965_14420 [Bacteroidia bacterium]
MFSACASHILEEQPDLPKPPEEEKPEGKPQWVLDDATIDALTKNGGLIINWIDTIAKKSASTRASNDVTIGPGGTPGVLNPQTEQERQQQVWQEQWDALKYGMEPLPYIYRKAADLTLDYETDDVKVVYDWWWFDETDKTWKMKPAHETAGVKLVVDRYWNYSPTDGWEHATGGMVTDNALKDIAKWQSSIAGQTRLAGYKTLYQEIDRFRYDYHTYLDINKLFFSGSMAETLMLDDTDKQKAPTLLLHEMDTYLRSNYVGKAGGEDRVTINEGVYTNSNDISEVYPPRPGGYSKADSAKQINKYGKFLTTEKMLESPIYVLQQDATLPSSHPELPNPKYSAPAAARGKLFEFYMGNVKGVDPAWWGGEEDAVIVLDDLDIYVGEIKPVSIRTIPSDISLAGIEWMSSIPDIASVKDGVAVGVSVGEAIISVSFEGRELARCTVRVTNDPDATAVTKVTLNKTMLEMYPGEVYDRLEASVTPPDATYRTVVWVSDDETIATVDSVGTVTAVSVGTTYIIARAGGVSAVCEVIVMFPAIILEDIVVHKGRTKLLKYTTFPPGSTLIDATWKSNDETIATVLAGAVTGVEEGKTTVTVTIANSRPASCTVTVLPMNPEDIPVESVAIYDADYDTITHSGGKELTELILPVGDTYQLHAEVLPDDATCDVVWVSEKPDIATVDQTGLVTAVKEGKANVIAIANGMTAVCEVSAETVTVKPPTLTVKMGETSDALLAVITPFNDPYETPVWWSENKDIATVDAKAGTVTGVLMGEVKIYATKGGGAYCVVTVKSNVEMDVTPDSLFLVVGERYNKLEVKITPPDGSDAAYTLSSENPDIAAVDEFGVIFGISEGKTKIFATTAAGLTDSCVVTVTYLIESEPFSSSVGNHTLEITLTNGTFAPATSLSMSQFALTTRGTRGVVSLDGGILRRASSTVCTITGLDSVKIAGEGQTITIHGSAFTTLPTRVWVVARGGPRDPSSPDLTIKFGKRVASDVLTQSIVYETYTDLHRMISRPAPNENFSTFVELGDYIDLLSLTLQDNDSTIIDKELDRGRLLRHIVVGINSFKRDIPSAVSISANNPGAPNHVVFQFQNAPLDRNMNPSATNAGGYYQSEMRSFLANSFFPGLKEAAGGITDEMFWAPSRKLLLPIGEGGSSADILWLPTVSEITGRDDWYPLHTTLQEEAKLPMARLEYYTNNDRRIKYDKDNLQGDYWLSTPLIVNPDGERLPQDLWPGPAPGPGLGWRYYWDLDRYHSSFCTIRSNCNLSEYHGEEYSEYHWKEAFHAFATHAIREFGCVPAFCIQ